MDGGDDRNCTVNWSIDGERKLREAVKEKLKESLGDYTDDALVEYVIVLLKSGRRKEQAKDELHVFLGDDSDSFITWLWDHLGSSLYLHSQFVSSIQSDDVACAEPTIQEPVGKMDSETVEGRSNKFSKPRRRRQWKGLAGDVEHQILKTSIAESDCFDEDSHRTVSATKPNESLHEGSQRKRLRTEARGPSKVLSTSIARGSKKIDELHEAAITAPRRLLQIAVRDAVGTLRPSISVIKPSSKQIRSVVSAASEDTTFDKILDSHRLVTSVSNNMSTVIKAVPEAAEDVKRVWSLRNVFNRLDCATNISDVSEQLTDFGDDFPRDRYVRPLDKGNVHSSYYDYFKEHYVSDPAFLARDAEMSPESGFEYDGYSDLEIRGRDVESSYYDDFEEQYISDTAFLARDTEMAPEYGFEYDRYSDLEIRDRDVESSYYDDFEEQYSSDTAFLARDTERAPEYGYEYDGYNDMEIRDRDVHSSYYDDFKEQYVSDTSFLPRDIEMSPESCFEYDGYYDMDIRGRGFKNVSVSSEVARKKVKDSRMLSYGAAKNNDGRSREAFSSVFAPDASHKIVTCNSPQYREARENMKHDSNKSKAENRTLAARLNLPLTEANTSSAVLANGNVKQKPSIVKESHKMQSSSRGPYSTSAPTDDADSRSIFVSNVHFAATKGSLSWHFNKFGEVLKVNILSDPATGLPKGSAYVEFMRKDSAEHALSLDGTSFMSRILKVIHKSAVPSEASCTIKRPHSTRSFPYLITGFSMCPIPRGAPNVYRGRPLKPGAKSLQWKHHMQSIPNQMSNVSSNTMLSDAAPRGLTYVRADPKMN